MVGKELGDTVGSEGETEGTTVVGTGVSSTQAVVSVDTNDVLRVIFSSPIKSSLVSQNVVFEVNENLKYLKGYVLFP